MVARHHKKDATDKPKTVRRRQLIQRARLEARRWAGLTAWQAGRYLEAAERLPGEVPPSTNIESLRRYFEDYDHAMAEAHYLTATTVQLARWLRSAGVGRKGENGEDVAAIRGLAERWETSADPTGWIGDGRHLYETIDTEVVRAAATALAATLTGQLRDGATET
jgi:hypothetical protein